jgi:hypothetical protein
MKPIPVATLASMLLLNLLLIPQTAFSFHNPSTGRWVNRDPIEEQGGPNIYGFDWATL